MNKNTDGRVKVTDEYNLFSFANGNRGVNPAHVKELRKSIEKYGVIPTPIIVNEKMEIIDGQHRFEACKMLNENVYYLVVPGTTMKHAAAMNANNKSWRLEDFLNYYASEGLPDYIFIKQLAKRSSLTLHSILRILGAGGGKDQQPFKNGEYKLSYDQTKAIDLIGWLEKFMPYMANIRGRRSCIIDALAWIKKNMDFDEERLINAVKTIEADRVDITDIKKAMEAMEEQYNYRLGKERKRYFLHEYETGGR